MYFFLPVHWLGRLVLEPQHEVDVVVGVLGEDVAGELGRAAQNGLNLADGN